MSVKVGSVWFAIEGWLWYIKVVLFIITGGGVTIVFY